MRGFYTMTNSKKVFFPGTFDPITLGHIDVIQQMKSLFETVVIGISAVNSTKKPALFSLEERKTLIHSILGNDSNIEFVSFSGLAVDAAHDCGATAIVRGIRNTSDFDYEAILAQTNRGMAPEITTLFVLPKPEFAYISSTIAREIATLGGDLKKLLPEPVILALQKKP